MGDLSSLFLFTAALCADSFAVSFVCGTGKIKIPRSSAWILSFCPAAVLAAASALGTVLRPLLPAELPDPSNIHYISGQIRSVGADHSPGPGPDAFFYPFVVYRPP